MAHSPHFFLLTWLAAVLPCVAYAEPVALVGMMGNKALLVVGNAAPKTLVPGQTYANITLVSTAPGEAVIEQAGKRRTLRVGEAPVNINSNSGDTASQAGRIVLKASSGGHFMTAGQINGKAVQFMVDTGATTIAMGALDAERAGINYKNGQSVTMATANGNTQGWRVKLASVRVGGVEALDVDAVVTPQAMPFMLLGNSFLARFAMMREGEQMTLIKRY